MLLGRTPNLADPFSKTVVKAAAGKRDIVLMFYLGLVARKPFFRVSDKAKLNPACSSTETS